MRYKNFIRETENALRTVPEESFDKMEDETMGVDKSSTSMQVGFASWRAPLLANLRLAQLS